MILSVLTPGEKVISAKISKLSTESPNGFFTILPRHTDFVSAVIPGILFYTDESGNERYAALDGGILLKKGDQIRLAVKNCIPGTDLGKLRQAVEDYFLTLDDQELKTKSIIAGLESDFVKKMVKMND